MTDRPSPTTPTPAQKKRRAAEAKGKRLELAVKSWLESRGWLVETAPKVTVWIWNPGKGAKIPISTRHDFFGVWDGIAVSETHHSEVVVEPLGILSGLNTRMFYQVTTLNHVAHKRRKIQDAGFPTTINDTIYAYVGRPGRWRIFRGPDFEMPGEAIAIRQGG